MSETVERRVSVSGEKFRQGYFSGIKAGKTNKEIAESLGMTVATFNVRLSQARGKARKEVEAAKAQGKEVVNPYDSVKTIRSRRVSSELEAANAVVASLDALDVKTTVTVENQNGEQVSA